MALESLVFFMDVIGFILIAVVLKFLIKNREFERFEVENSLNALLFGFFLLFVAYLMYIFIGFDKAYHATITSYLPNAAIYAGYFQSVIDLGILPLFAVCFFVGIFLAREYLKDYPLLAKEEPKKQEKKYF